MSAGRERALALHSAIHITPGVTFDCRGCQDIAAALDEAEERGRRQRPEGYAAQWRDVDEKARAEGFAAGLEAAAQSVQEYWDDVRGRGENFSVSDALDYVRALQPPPSAKERG